MADGMMRILLTLSIALCSAAASAEDLPDPTRPPAFLMGTGAGTVPGQWSSGSPSSGLQSTIISESRRAAIIDGKTVELWAKHGNAQLIEVNEGSVVLRTAQTRRILTLFPDVKMTLRKAFVRAPGREIKTRRASPGNGVQPEEISTMPAPQYEKPLSGHPKEEK
jgi:MSHA biogenesis protein MshK